MTEPHRDAITGQLTAEIASLRAQLDQVSADRDEWMHLATRYRYAAEQGVQEAAARAAREVDAFLHGQVTEGRGK